MHRYLEGEYCNNKGNKACLSKFFVVYEPGIVLCECLSVLRMMEASVDSYQSLKDTMGVNITAKFLLKLKINKMRLSYPNLSLSVLCLFIFDPCEVH